MLDMTQTELANKLDVAFQQVQKYEKGLNRIGAGRLQHLANVLQVPVSYFFAEDAPASVLADKAFLSELNQLMTTRDGVDLVTAFSKVKDKKLRRLVVKLIEGIADRQ